MNQQNRTFSDFRRMIAGRSRGKKPFAKIAILERELEKLAQRQVERGVYTLPSQHTKSTTIDEFTAYLIGCDPLIHVIVAAYNTRATRKHSRNVKRILRSPVFEEFFGWEPVFSKDTEDDWQLAWPGQEGSATYLARSIESPALGETADFLIIDDPLSGGLKGASPAKQERAWESISNVLMQRLTPGARVAVIATLWTEADPSMKLLEAWKSSKVPAVYLNLAALNEDGRSSFRWDIREREPHYLEAYDVLWPEYRDLEFIRRKKDEMLPEDFETQFQGNPIAGAGLVSEDAWKYYEELPALFYAAIIVDTGVERSETNDPTNAIAVGYGATGAYLLDSVEGKWSVDEMEEEILALYQRVARRMGARQPAEYPYMVPLIIIEKAALGRPLHDALIKKLPPFIVKMCSTEGQSKLIRARAQAHHIQRGKVFLPKHSAFTREIIRQWLAFPRGAHDEYVDTLSYALRHADNVRIAREYIERMFGAFNPAWVNALDNGFFDTREELLDFEHDHQLLNDFFRDEP